MNRKDVGLVLVICLAAGLLYILFGRRSKGDGVVITVDGREYGRYSLSEDREIPIQTEDGYNLVVIEEGSVFVKEADCPDRYCVKQGKKKQGNSSLVCLPHKLVVEVKAEEEAGLDAIVQ